MAIWRSGAGLVSGSGRTACPLEWPVSQRLAETLVKDDSERAALKYAAAEAIGQRYGIEIDQQSNAAPAEP